MAADELRRAARKVRSLPNQMVRVGAQTIKPMLVTAYTQDSGGDLRLSGLRNSGVFRVSTSVRGEQAARGRVFMGGPMAGPAKWLNEGTRPRRQGAGMHPGTRGKQTFDRAATTALPRAEQEMVRLFERSLEG